MNAYNCRFAWLLSVSFLPSLGPGPTYAQEIPASSAGLVISEIFYNPQGSDDFEFVEFYNAGTSSLNLSGFKLVKDDKGDGLEFEFTAEVLQPGAYILVAEDSVRFTQRYMTAGSPYFNDGLNLAGQWKGGLRDSGEKLQVLDPDGELIFTFTYRDGGDWPLLASGMGSSLELKVLSGLPADLGEREKFLETPGNWRASSEFHGNPGRAGQVPDRRVVINEVLANTDAQVTDTIELYNPTSVEVSVGGWFLSDSTTFDKFRIPDGTTIPSFGFLTFDETQFNPNGEWNPNAGSPGENEFSLSGSKGDDVWLVISDGSGGVAAVGIRADSFRKFLIII